MSSTPTPRRSRWLLLIFGLAAITVLSGAGWLLWEHFLAPTEPYTEVVQLNNRGAGLMAQFGYEEAVTVFEEVTRKAPRWQPGHINLGIALLQTNKKESLDRAADIFRRVLARDPENNHADFCLGLILKNKGGESLAEAAKHFEAVARRDPTDAHAWAFRAEALSQSGDMEEAEKCYAKALELDPYFPGVLNQLQLSLRRAGKEKEANEALARFQGLRDADWANPADAKYGETGKYGEVIAQLPTRAQAATGPLPPFVRSPGFKATLGPKTKWATSADFGTGAVSDLHRLVRHRFGATIVALDYDGDGKTDVLLLAAVTRDGKLGDLLLRNEGGGHFRDVTDEAGLAGAPAGLGCQVADCDNDGWPDLLVTDAGGVRLWRNAPAAKGRRFEDVTKAVGLTDVKGAFLGAAFLDIDQDSDLDLVLARCGGTPEEALANLKAPANARGAGLVLLLNVGKAPPDGGKKGIGLTPAFREDGTVLPAVKGVVVNILVSDLDDDRDLDLLVFADGQPPVAILNDRLLKFHARELPSGLKLPTAANGGLVLDLNHDEKADLFLIGSDKARLLVQGRADGEAWFQDGNSDSPPLLHAQAADIDLDGRTDVVGLSDQRRPVLLHHDGKRLKLAEGALGAASEWPADVVAVLVLDADDDKLPDVLVWSEAEGLRLLHNQGNGNRSLPVVLTGRRDKATSTRSNSDGIGAWLTVQTPDGCTKIEVATLQGGLGQSRQPILVGLAKAAVADFVRIRWPDLVLQAELDLPATVTATIRETNRRGNSCPILFAWNGRTYGYVTDFLGAGSIGEMLPGGGHRPPRGDESVKIEAHQLVPKDGKFLLKFAEPMDEVTYLDRVQLLVVDHPDGMQVYPDERFIAGSKGPSQDLLAFERDFRVFPLKATDHRGRDVTKTLREWDRDSVDRFAKRAWLGYAEEHAVELDFGDRLAGIGAKERVCMFLAGWTDYPYPESIWAATQAGVELLPPVLERWDGGKWQAVPVEFGFPAGLPRMMAVELTGHLNGPACKLRLRTNMHVAWDQIFVAPLAERVPAGKVDHAGGRLRVTGLDVQSATLATRGFCQEFSPDGKEPTQYDHDRLEPVAVSRLAGKLTKLGDVTELLRERDDRFVIFGPGDEVSAAFAADGLPKLPAGWTRSYVLRTWGYCKDTGPFTATGGTIDPLPFQAMSGFPYGPNERYPRTPRHEEYLRLWNTRKVGP